MTELDIHEVMKYLPHRYPFILVDKVLEFEKGKSLVAIKNVSINEPHFTGHFPYRPVMPGVLILEALAQASVILAFKTLEHIPNEEDLVYFAGVDKVRFKRVVEPGDQLKLAVELTGQKRDIWKFHGTASVDGQEACSADLISAWRKSE